MKDNLPLDKNMPTDDVNPKTSVFSTSPKSEKLDKEDSKKLKTAVTEPTKINTPIKKINKKKVQVDSDVLSAAVIVHSVGLRSAARISTAVATALSITWILVVGVSYFLLDILGVWKKINEALSGDDVGSSATLFPVSTVIGVTFLSGLVIFILTLLMGICSAVIYNICAETFGGISVVLKDNPHEVD